MLGTGHNGRCISGYTGFFRGSWDNVEMANAEVVEGGLIGELQACAAALHLHHFIDLTFK